MWEISQPKYKRLTAYATLMAIFFIENFLFKKMNIYGSRPELLLVITVFFGFYFGTAYGAEIGFLSGLLKDIFSVTFFGVNILLFILVGILAGSFRNKLAKESIIAQILFSIFAVYLLAMAHFFCLDELVRSDLGGEFWLLTFFKAIYTAVLVPLLFFILSRIFKVRSGV